MQEALNIHVSGIVQGVGFRPFVFRMAQQYAIKGWVLNAIDGVHVHAEGEENDLDRFTLSLANEAPAAAHVSEVAIEECAPEGFSDFEIRFSDGEDVERTTLVSPDLATCDECVAELFDEGNRRFHYPFINCTNCGPRFTIIDALPYDRPKTSMGKFKMCRDCAEEYANPADRRFHAQPDACFECGPHVSFQEAEGEGFSDAVWGNTLERSDSIVSRAVDLVKRGNIVAVKGLGGFHLVCDAENAEAVKLLRVRKRRDGKAFAVMMANLDAVRDVCEVNDEEQAQLISPARPIVLLRKRPDAKIGDGVADGLPELGVMLPATPVQHLLMRAFGERQGRMLVMTSGNLHDEPIVIDDDAARRKFVGIADAIMGNNREILSRFDDSVVRVMDARSAGKFVQVVRRARGFAPLPIDLSFARQEDEAKAPVVFATGPEQKSTCAILEGGRAFVSQHIGDLEDAPSYDAWLEAKRRLQKLFNVEPTQIACDMHPSYLSTQWAQEQSLPRALVQHHHAHVVAVMAENKISDAVCGIAFDGTGMGVDNTVWGGEVLLSNLHDFERFANFSYVPMPGGAACVKQPLRMAYGVLYNYDLLEHPGATATLEALGNDANMLEQMIDQDINTPYTSSVGRLFDAASALLGICTKPSYQGEGAILLEAAIGGAPDPESAEQEQAALERYAVGVVKNIATDASNAQNTSVLLFDAGATFTALLDDHAVGVPVGVIARRFHEAVIGAAVQAAELVQALYGITKVVLSGGVFMNRYLMENAVERLCEKGFTVAVSRDLPPNDGAISFGQAVVSWQRRI